MVAINGRCNESVDIIIVDVVRNISVICPSVGPEFYINIMPNDPKKPVMKISLKERSLLNCQEELYLGTLKI